MIMAVMIGTFFLLLLLGMPIVFCIGMASALALLVAMPADITVTTMAQQATTGLDSFTLLAIPFFILSGYLMSEGGMAQRLILAARVVLGGIPGGLAFTNVLSCMVFGSVSGSAIASTSAIGSFMGPEMSKAGYPKAMSAAITVSAATTGLLIPPSNVLIIYAVASGGVSIAALFAAGYIPGLVLGVMLMFACFYMSKSLGIPVVAKVPRKDAVKALVGAVLPLSMIAIIIGGILTGIFTATESGAVAVLYALFLSMFVYKEVTPKTLLSILKKSAQTTGTVLWLIGFSIALAWVMAYANIPQLVTDNLLAVSEDPIVLLLLINLLLLLVGAFLDITPALLIFTPILLPVATQIGLSPIHFGIILVLNFSLGLCTPPVGTVMFVGSAVFGVPVEKMFRYLLPLFGTILVVLMLITFLPSMSLFLPKLLNLVN